MLGDVLEASAAFAASARRGAGRPPSSGCGRGDDRATPPVFRLQVQRGARARRANGERVRRSGGGRRALRDSARQRQSCVSRNMHSSRLLATTRAPVGDARPGRAATSWSVSAPRSDEDSTFRCPRTTCTHGSHCADGPPCIRDETQLRPSTAQLDCARSSSALPQVRVRTSSRGQSKRLRNCAVMVCYKLPTNAPLRRHATEDERTDSSEFSTSNAIASKRSVSLLAYGCPARRALARRSAVEEPNANDPPSEHVARRFSSPITSWTTCGRIRPKHARTGVW